MLAPGEPELMYKMATRCVTSIAELLQACGEPIINYGMGCLA